MGQLVDLYELGSQLQADFENTFVSDDVKLPESFKNDVQELGGYKYDYKSYLVHIHSEELNGYIPNQWFIIASFFVDYYLALMKYKSLLFKVFAELNLSKEEIKRLVSLYPKKLDALNKTDKTNTYEVHKKQVAASIREEVSDLFKDIQIDVNDKSLLIEFVSNYDWWKGGKTIDRGDFYISPILSLAKVINASHSYIAEICKALSEKKSTADSLKGLYKHLLNTENFDLHIGSFPLQQIFYGAPGTGKSYAIKGLIKSASHVRTTFHPDSDYSSFVGAYKPTMEKTGVIRNGKEETKISYNFVAQAFLKAYIAAWRNYPKPQYLVIEEINRGNCAQIFGDLFQLLDRNDEGFSDYPIIGDEDLQRYIHYEFINNNAIGEEDKTKINDIYSGEYENIMEKVLNGELLLLPNNLYIYATMNTSDQSLFPIDSAFKRRWDWQYMPISNAKKDWVIEVNGNHYDWWNFLEKINGLIGEVTYSEDKKLGYFFCKSNNRIISAKTFVGKVIFYLWNDVFKDFEFQGEAFEDLDDNGKLSFDKFYISFTEINERKVGMFLSNIGLDPLEEYEDEFIEETEDIETSENNSISEQDNSAASLNVNRDKYVINGTGKQYGKCKVPYEAVKKYSEINSTLTAKEIVEKWSSLSLEYLPHFIETEEAHKQRGLRTKDAKFEDKSKPLELSNGERIYISNQFTPSRIKELMTKLNQRNWNIHIEEVDK